MTTTQHETAPGSPDSTQGEVLLTASGLTKSYGQVQALRQGDRAARYGGEEFVLLLQAEAGAVPAVLGRLRQRWALAYPHITFSTGWAVHTGSRPAHTTIGEADRALYEAKTSGRNRDVEEVAPALVS